MTKEYTSIDPKLISFGAPAAEREEHLGQYFYQTESYSRLLEGEKTVVLGNRGSGKTAILKSLARQRRGRRTVVEMVPDDYSYEILQKVLREETEGAWAKQAAYAAAWKYMLLVSAMKAAVNAARRLKGGPIGKLYSFLRDNFRDSAENPISMLISYIKRIEGVKVGKYEGGIRARELQRLYRLEELDRPRQYLTAIAKKSPVLILVDELDRGWDNSEDARGFVAGLFNAALSINQEQEGLRVVLSLRLEMYRNIPSLFDDAQKYRDIIEFIIWDRKSLLEMIGRRIQYSLPQIRFLKPEHIWPRVFSETLSYRNAKSFRYLLDRTLYRPRELIQFCEIVRDLAVKRRLTTPFDYDVIKDAELLHSEARLNDIAAEYRFELPGLGKVFETFRGMQYLFTKDGMEYHCLRLCVGEVNLGQAAGWCQDCDAEDLVGILWRVGFLQGQIRATSSGKTSRRYVGPHQVHSLNVADCQRFQVHPMFRRHLGMKQGTYRG